jgi:hypothetical protein
MLAKLSISKPTQTPFDTSGLNKPLQESGPFATPYSALPKAHARQGNDKNLEQNCPESLREHISQQ